MDKKILELFALDEMRLTNENEKPGILISLEVKKDYDEMKKSYLDTVSGYAAEVFFEAFRREKIIVRIQADTVCAADMKELIAKLENGEEIPVTFKNLLVSLRMYRGELSVYATADGIEELVSI